MKLDLCSLTALQDIKRTKLCESRIISINKYQKNNSLSTDFVARKEKVLLNYLIKIRAEGKVTSIDKYKTLKITFDINPENR